MNNEITVEDIIKAIDEIDDIFSEERKEENENFWCGYKYAITRIQNYITNLQQEKEKWFAVAKDFEMEAHDLWNKNNELEHELEEYKDTETYSKRFLYKANKDRLNANLELVKENERLKTKAKEQSLLLIDYQDMEQKLEDYKSRIEKAVEILKRYTDNESNYYVPVFELLDILNGRSDK